MKELIDYKMINNRINKMLKFCKYRKRNMLYLKDNIFYLFGVQVSQNTTDYELVEIINCAKSFECMVKYVFKDMKLGIKYKFDYNDMAVIVVENNVGIRFTIQATYQDVRQRFE